MVAIMARLPAVQPILGLGSALPDRFWQLLRELWHLGKHAKRLL